MTVILRVPGRPRGKQRPKFNRQQGRSYTPQETVVYESKVHAEWIAAGRPRLPDEPLVAALTAVYERPASHRRKDGSLSAAGERAPWPMPQVDLDNVAKIALDALNGLAYKDDRQVVHLTVNRRWAQAGESEHLFISVMEVEA